MALNNIAPKKGRLLLAEPMLQEDYFKRSVVLITEHNESGTIGFILNKKVDLTLNEAIHGFESIELPLYLGGPVKKDNLFFIHTFGNKVEGSMEIIKGLYWGGDFNTIRSMLLNGRANESNIRFFIGYSGWEPSQLDNEITENSWVVSNTNTGIVMGSNNKTIWQDVLRSMDGRTAILSFYPENPQMN